MEKLEYLQKLNPYLPYDLVVMSGDSYDTDDLQRHKGLDINKRYVIVKIEK